MDNKSDFIQTLSHSSLVNASPSNFWKVKSNVSSGTGILFEISPKVKLMLGSVSKGNTFEISTPVNIELGYFSPIAIVQCAPDPQALSKTAIPFSN